MNFVELKKLIDKQLNRDVKLAEMARALNTSAQNFGKKYNKPSTEVTLTDIYNLESFFNLQLIQFSETPSMGDRIEISYWNDLPDNLKNPKIVSVWFDREIIENAWGMSAEHLCIVPMVGDKMTHYWYPIYNNDILIVDTSQDYIMGNGVYFATSKNNTRFWIREMQILINNDVQIKGFAPSGDTTKVLSAETLKEADFKIIGKVIKNVSFRL